MGNKAIRDDGGYFDHWNEWAVYIEMGNIVHGPFEEWWYGEWW